MATFTNRIREGGFMQSEANFARSRDKVTLEGGGSSGTDIYYAGSVLGQITASGKYKLSANTGSDGSQVAVAILWDDYVDTTDGDVVVGVCARDAEVRADSLTYDSSVTTLAEQEAKWAQLAAVGIIVRIEGGVQVDETT